MYEEEISTIKDLYIEAFNQYVELAKIKSSDASYYKNIATGLKMALACLNQKIF